MKHMCHQYETYVTKSFEADREMLPKVHLCCLPIDHNIFRAVVVNVKGNYLEHVSFFLLRDQLENRFHKCFSVQEAFLPTI